MFIEKLRFKICTTEHNRHVYFSTIIITFFYTIATRQGFALGTAIELLPLVINSELAGLREERVQVSSREVGLLHAFVYNLNEKEMF